MINALADPAKFFYGGRVPITGRTMAKYISDVISNQAMVPQDSRAMQVGVGAQGGFSAPEIWVPGFFKAVNNISVFLPRVRSYSFDGSNTAHIIGWNDYDQTAGPYGGVASQWLAEGATGTAVDPKIDQKTLKAKKNMHYVNVTREVAKYTENLISELSTQMARSVAYSFDYAIYNGSGIGQPLGILQSNSVVNVSRAVANQVSYDDVVNMYTRLAPNFIVGAAWFCSPNVLGQLLTMTDGASSLIWMPAQGGVAVNRPGFLLGLPVYATSLCQELGTKGDLVLADLGAYAFGVSQDVTIEKSESARWFQDEMCFRACMMADGMPLMSSVITPKNGGDTLSWAVVLGA